MVSEVRITINEDSNYQTQIPTKTNKLAHKIQTVAKNCLLMMVASISFYTYFPCAHPLEYPLVSIFTGVVVLEYLN